LRYACLELRFCLEALAYEKLGIYSKRVPQSVLDTWQPPQAIKALLEFEPLADEGFTLTMSPESSPGVPTGDWQVIGTHSTLKLSLIRKYYNKLGNFLHIPSPARTARQASVSPTVDGLKEMLEEMRPAVYSHFDASMATVVEWECSVCNGMSVANLDGLKESKKAFCLNPQCGALHHAVCDSEGEIELHLDASHFKCAQCGEEIELENRKLAIGLQFKCWPCGAVHKIAGRQWSYGQPLPPQEGGG